jgi:hypothetical protein
MERVDLDLEKSMKIFSYQSESEVSPKKKVLEKKLSQNFGEQRKSRVIIPKEKET